MRAGAEVAQAYAALPAGLVGRAKVALQPGQAQRVAVTIAAKRFATWGAGARAWRLNAAAIG
ncbi:beta-glucosidase [Burkholderia pseudomallei]|nr:beta-glucosidase [Burkholderia pseudomallei]